MTLSLVKEKAQTATLILEKRNLPAPPPLRVCAAFDVSYSAQGLFSGGLMQKAFDQLLGAALKLDDNGEIDTWVFDSVSSKIATATPDDYGDFIAKKLLRSGAHLWGGTNYAPPIDLIMEEMFDSGRKSGGLLGGLFGKKKAPTTSEEPVLVFFLTDGDNNDKTEAMRALERSQGKPIYWNMVGVGRASFPFLEKVADDYDHVGFIRVPENSALSDEAMYEALFTDEFVSWVKGLSK